MLLIISNTFSNTDDSESSDSDLPVKNSVFQISIGYKY